MELTPDQSRLIGKLMNAKAIDINTRNTMIDRLDAGDVDTVIADLEAMPDYVWA